MWEFRRPPPDLSEEDQQQLEGLFGRLPRLRKLYELRVRFPEIFDTAKNRRQAHRALVELFFVSWDHFPEMETFLGTFEDGQEEILNYLDARQTSATVEGLNNKARVILKRSYGLKLADSLWTRLILDVNRAADVVLYTIGPIHDLVAGFRAAFACT